MSRRRRVSQKKVENGKVVRVKIDEVKGEVPLIEVLKKEKQGANVVLKNNEGKMSKNYRKSSYSSKNVRKLLKQKENKSSKISPLVSEIIASGLMSPGGNGKKDGRDELKKPQLDLDL